MKWRTLRRAGVQQLSLLPRQTTCILRHHQRVDATPAAAVSEMRARWCGSIVAAAAGPPIPAHRLVAAYGIQAPIPMTVRIWVTTTMRISAATAGS
jgi:hypothetical protein